MRTNIEDALIEIIRKVVIEKSEVSLSVSTEEEKAALLKLARLHQVDHIVAYALFKAGDSKYSNKFFSSIAQTTKQTHAAKEAADALRERGIPFILLKGSVLRSLYPESWMRNSCDVDILVKEENLDVAGEALAALSYVREDGLSSHDVTYAKGSVHIELHYTLIEEYRFEVVAKVLSGVWESSSSLDSSEHILSDEMFYFYHIAHMLKHFENGGCGVRSLVDLWFLNHRCEYSREKREALLLKAGILKFARGMERIADYWFSDASAPESDTLEKFIFSGGAYGKTDNSVALKTKRSGKFSYVFFRLFVPYAQLRRYYPVLNKHPYLLPFFEVKRWFDAFRRDRKRYINELNNTVKKDGGDDIEAMLDSLGLK